MLTYKDSGVDRQKLARFKKDVFYHFLKEPGAFGGRIKLDIGGNRILFATIDGIGTKLKLLAEKGLYEQAGYDLVNHIAADLAACDAVPLHFLDYISFSQLDDDILEKIGLGLLGACFETGFELIAGETSQMPDYYPIGEFELVGVGIGVAQESKTEPIISGDALVSLPSLGLNTNGYSLARKALFEVGKLTLDSLLDNIPLWQHLLLPHKLYSHIVALIPDNFNIRGKAHITGGGIHRGLRRVLPDGLGAVIYKRNLPSIPIFNLIQESGKIDDEEMFATFNMGAGFVLILPQDEKDELLAWLESIGEQGFELGKITDENSIIFEE